MTDILVERVRVIEKLIHIPRLGYVPIRQLRIRIRIVQKTFKTRHSLYVPTVDISRERSRRLEHVLHTRHRAHVPV